MSDPQTHCKPTFTGSLLSTDPPLCVDTRIEVLTHLLHRANKIISKTDPVLPYQAYCRIESYRGLSNLPPDEGQRLREWYHRECTIDEGFEIHDGQVINLLSRNVMKRVLAITAVVLATRSLEETGGKEWSKEAREVVERAERLVEGRGFDWEMAEVMGLLK